MEKMTQSTGDPSKSLYGLPTGDFDFKKFVESYRCRICKVDLNLDNFGGLGPNHGIFCRNCYKISPRYS